MKRSICSTLLQYYYYTPVIQYQNWTAHHFLKICCNEQSEVTSLSLSYCGTLKSFGLPKGKKTVFSTNGVERTGYLYAKSAAEPFCYTTHKNQSEQVKDLNVRVKTTKFLEENIGEKFHDTGFGNTFSDMTPKTQ